MPHFQMDAYWDLNINRTSHVLFYVGCYAPMPNFNGVLSKLARKLWHGPVITLYGFISV